MSETFAKLLPEKRQRIINAAMKVFAEHGYKKASVADIAAGAGISKAMIFTYFGSKKGCYSYACEQMIEIASAEFEKCKDEFLSVSDFFERLIMAVRLKVIIFKKSPPLLDFAMSVYKETDEEVQDIIKQNMQKGLQLRQIFLTSGIDSSRLKNPADESIINRMTYWLSSGAADEWMRSGEKDVDAIFNDFIHCINVLRERFCKE